MADEKEKQRQAFRLDLNAPIAIELQELENRPVNVTLVDLSEGGARIRSRSCLPYSWVTFTWRGPSREPLKLYGAMVGAKITEYKESEFGVRFEMPQVEKDRLAAELHEIQRRAAFKPAETKLQIDEAGGGIGRAKRKAYRAPVKFAVSIRINKMGHISEIVGMAHDLSIGGLLLVSPETLLEGSEIGVNFVLPVEAVDLGGEQREVIEKGPFGDRKAKKLVPVKPFEPVDTKAKVVKRVGASPEGTAYGTCFIDLSAFMREEIARFVHAYQLTQLRKAADD
ncbi:MAG: PilZ domain-containing protein [Candidatus Eremiobacteraeota bacterium]|nr:PilZ domain-containing protein [Candidatus Eremiobacteraeota bacterium]